MTSDEARNWMVERFGTVAEARVSRFVEYVIAESSQQNLIAASTLPEIWVRHILDSAQLVDLVPSADHWVDVGSGAGFPGMVVAILSTRPTTLVEPRRRRAEFLAMCAAKLQLGATAVIQSSAERCHLAQPASVISARAVASIDSLFDMTAHIAGPATRYVLPRGRSAATEVEKAREAWHGVFHVKQSLSDPYAGIVIADRVRPR